MPTEQPEQQGEQQKQFKNRGFCFVEFIDHKSASMAKRKLSSARFNKLFNREIVVDWAEQSDEPDEETMAKVKVLYVRNLTMETTEQEVEKTFEVFGTLERVRKMKDYAFVHFETRENAMKAMEQMQGTLLNNNPMEITLARPLTEKKKQMQQHNQQKQRYDNNGPMNKRGFNNNFGDPNGDNWNNNFNNNRGNNFNNNKRFFNNNNNNNGNQRFNNNFNNNNNNRNGGKNIDFNKLLSFAIKHSLSYN